MSKPSMLGVARRSLLCATLVAGLCATASPRTRGSVGAAAAPAAARRPCGEMTEHIMTDFSGHEYNGKLSYPGQEMYGDATLTVSGEIKNQTFTLTAGGKSLTGRLTSETTCGYTTVALKFDDPAPADPSKPPPPAGAGFLMRACAEGAGSVLRTADVADFNFTAEGPAPAGAPRWGQCNRKVGKLRGNRPL